MQGLGRHLLGTSCNRVAKLMSAAAVAPLDEYEEERKCQRVDSGITTAGVRQKQPSVVMHWSLDKPIRYSGTSCHSEGLNQILPALEVSST